MSAFIKPPRRKSRKDQIRKSGGVGIFEPDLSRPADPRIIDEVFPENPNQEGAMCKVYPNFPNSFVGWAAVALLATCLACGGSGGGGATPPLPAQPYIRSATLTGTQEAPGNPSVASGTGSISVDPTTRAITGTLTTAGVTATAAHIHEGVKGGRPW